jgi:nucleotide-binding universal stress UspA family protein
MIETVLVATDGSEAAAAAERYGVSLAARLGARLVGLSVIEERVTRGLRAEGLGVAAPSGDAIEAFLAARAEAACRRLTSAGREKGVECGGETTRGIADDAIVERGKQADLLVLGRDGEHAGARTALIGSTVDGVLRKTSKPVVVVPQAAELSGPLLLAFDGSPGSRIAARLAVEIAGKLGENIHVFVDSKDKGRSAARFDEVRRLLGTPHVGVREAASTLGRPDAKIVDAAREAAAGMIVMGAFGRSRIHEYFLGSNSAAVVRSSPIAVLLAR